MSRLEAPHHADILARHASAGVVESRDVGRFAVVVGAENAHRRSWRPMFQSVAGEVR